MFFLLCASLLFIRNASQTIACCKRNEQQQHREGHSKKQNEKNNRNENICNAWNFCNSARAEREGRKDGERAKRRFRSSGMDEMFLLTYVH